MSRPHEGFVFSLADAELGEEPEGGFLLSRWSPRKLRFNRPLYRLLKYLQEGGELAGFVRENPGLGEGSLLRILLSLVSRGYLRIEKIAGLEDWPRVSIIIPVRDQPENLIGCLHSLTRLNYPGDRREILVVDDGSREEISPMVAASGVRVIRQAESLGAAAGRNTGAGHARGDILAFLDADCVAGEDWLKEIVPFFATASAGAIGGLVDGYYHDSYLDRYEAVASPLNLGRRLLMEGNTDASFYVPTANMLVTREAFLATGGFRAGMQLGEDVDFCWRLRNLGYTLFYVPFGRVAHKHRSQFGKMLKRRSEYGMSEAGLYRTHREKRKTFLLSPYVGLSFLALTLAILLASPYPLGFVLLFFGLDLGRKSRTLKRIEMAVPFRQVIAATLRNGLSFYYFVFFHLVRYYLILIGALGFWLHTFWLWGGVAVLYASAVDYYVKRPKMSYPVYLFFYLAEHLAYQAGVFWGCVRQKYFGSYRLKFRRA